MPATDPSYGDSVVCTLPMHPTRCPVLTFRTVIAFSMEELALAMPWVLPPAIATLWFYAFAMRPAVLRVRYAMCRTDLSCTYGPTRSLCDVRHRPTRVLCNVRSICLRACYAMPGTGIAYRAVDLRARYAMPGIDAAYRATSTG
eukprot:307665-Rhodomonas_salina.2